MATETTGGASAAVTRPDGSSARSLLKAPENLTHEQTATPRRLRRAGSEVWRAYTLKEAPRVISIAGQSPSDLVHRVGAGEYPIGHGSARGPSS